MKNSLEGSCLAWITSVLWRREKDEPRLTYRFLVWGSQWETRYIACTDFGFSIYYPDGLFSKIEWSWALQRNRNQMLSCIYVSQRKGRYLVLVKYEKIFDNIGSIALVSWFLFLFCGKNPDRSKWREMGLFSLLGQGAAHHGWEVKEMGCGAAGASLPQSENKWG